LAEAVRTQAGQGVFLFSTPNFKSLGALQERCRVFISSDGGPMHFSVAVGTPTVGLFGKTDPRLWGPWGDGHVSLRRGNHADLIPVDEVYQSVKKWIKT
jgi:heptosyltransferase-3